LEGIVETFESFANRWQQTILTLKKPASRATLSSHLRLLSSKLGPRPLAELTYPEVQKVFSVLAETHSPRSCRNIFGAYRILLSQAKREKLVEKFPIPVLPKVRKIEQDWLELNQMRAIIKAADNKQKPLVALLSEAGPRIGECLGLTPSDIDGQILRIERSIWGGSPQDPKTDNAVRKMYISKQLRDLLRTCNTNGFLFHTRSGTPAWPTELRRMVLDPLLKSLGIEPVGFHAFRRGCASALASQFGMPTKILGSRLGHSHADLTLGVYAQTVDGADKPYIDKYAEALYG
jgi:integrase